MKAPDTFNERWTVESKEKWREFVDTLPFIKFPAAWEIQIIPPFSRAIIRYRARQGNSTVSVYFDAYEQLGCFGSPHWEIYPDKDGENTRFAAADVEGMLKAIQESLDEQNKTSGGEG